MIMMLNKLHTLMLRFEMINPMYGLILFFFFFLTSVTDATNPNDDVEQFLGAQNQARAAVRLPPLVWNAKVARYAASYANQRRVDCALQHSNGPYGENIFWGSGSEWTPAQAAAAWVSEGQYYNYGSNSCANGQQCGHYTQIVWRATKSIGCARVVCDGGKGVFMTCNYDPPGNYAGERPY